MLNRAWILALLAIGCSTQETPAPPTSTAPAATAPATASSAAVKSPLHVVLESKAKITMAGVVDGVWISEGAGKRVAQAKRGEELTSGPLPDGLPAKWARILNVSGYLDRVWVSLELDEKGDSNLPKTPIYRFDGKEFRRIAEDWKPLVTIWSAKRPLAMWTSAGKLKAKVPLHTPEIPDDLPGSHLDDSRCPYNLRLDQLAGLPTGDVFGLGTCTPAGAKGQRSVLVHWPSEETPDPEATAQPAATAAPTATAQATAVAPAPTAAPSASALAPPSATATAAPTATPADPGAQADEEQPGIRGHVFVLPGLERTLAHRSLIARSATDVLVAGVDLDEAAKPKSYLWRFDGSTYHSIDLPGSEPLRAVAQCKDGTLWLATDHGVWTKGKGAWQAVAPPQVGAAEAKWSYLNLVALDDTVWISAEAGQGQYVVLRTKATQKKISW